MQAACGVRCVITAAVLLSAFATQAQDTRHVTEPGVPPACSSLTASLAGPEDAPLDTARIQEAIDNCPGGKAVILRRDGAKSAFVSGPLELRRGVTLVVDAGATLFASRDPKLFDTGSGVCGTDTAKSEHGCKPLIHVGAPDAAVMGDGTIDGRGGATLFGRNVSWWDLAHQAKVENAYQNCPRLIIADKADDFTLYRITLKNSPNFHVIVMRTNGFTAWGVKIDAPKTARNTDGIDPSSSTNVTIAYCFIRAGDDNVAIKASANGPAAHMTIAHNHFYYGHGMSIGSETNGGVDAIEVRDLTIDGADNGLRIKSNSTRGGLVHDVTYDDVCIRNTKEPIVIDPFYSTERGTLVPRFENVTLRNVRVLTPGRITIRGTDPDYLSRVRFDGVQIDFHDPKLIRASHARISIGPGGANLVPDGDDVQVEGKAGVRKSIACEARFVPFPATSSLAASPIPRASRATTRSFPGADNASRRDSRRSPYSRIRPTKRSAESASWCCSTPSRRPSAFRRSSAIR